MEILIKEERKTKNINENDKNVLALLTTFMAHLFLCEGNLECFIVN